MTWWGARRAFTLTVLDVRDGLDVNTLKRERDVAGGKTAVRGTSLQ